MSVIVPRLMRPNTKIVQRAERRAIATVALEAHLGHADLEDQYTNTRNALAHLYAHDRYRTHVEDKVAELVAMTFRMLAQPGIEKISKDPQWTAKLTKATENLDHERRVMRTENMVTQKHIQRFIRIIDETRRLLLKEDYEATSVITPVLYVLANMIDANFTAYEKTLNGT